MRWPAARAGRSGAVPGQQVTTAHTTFTLDFSGV